MKKIYTKIVSMLLVIAMIFPLIPIMPVYANNGVNSNQPSPENLDISKIYHVASSASDGSITPYNINLMWTAPSESPYRGSLKMYYLTVTDVGGSGANTLDLEIQSTVNTVNLDQLLLENGVLYRADLYAVYSYPIYDEDGQVARYEEELSPATSGYFLTDVDLDVKAYADSLVITWDYLPGMNYDLVVEQGSYSDIGDFSDNVAITFISDEDIQSLLYTENGRKRVRYEYTNNIVGGLWYSVYVKHNLDSQYWYDGVRLYAGVTDPLFMYGDSPEVVNGMPPVPLTVTDIGNQEIQLEWKITEYGSSEYTLYRTYIYAKTLLEPVSNTDGELVGTFYADGSNICFFNLDEPEDATWYWALFEFVDSDGKVITSNSNEWPKAGWTLYTPHEVIDRPTSPQIPLPVAPGMEILVEDYSKYLVTGDDNFGSFSDDYFYENKFATYSYSPLLTIQLIWDVITTYAGGSDPDYDVTYDIWITNSSDDIFDTEDGSADFDPTYADVKFDEDDTDYFIYNNLNSIVGLKTYLQYYYDATTRTTSPLIANQTYYITMIAKKNGYESEATRVIITLDKDGDIFTPPVLGKPPLRLAPSNIPPLTLR